MMRIWERMYKEEGYRVHYRQFIDLAGSMEEYRVELREFAAGPFRDTRDQAGAAFEWSEAEFDGARINKAPGTSNRLVGFFVKAGGQRYEFRFFKTKPGLHVLAFRGPAK